MSMVLFSVSDEKEPMTFDRSAFAPEKEMQELRRLNALFIENFVRNDVKSHDAILHERFVYLNSRGARIDRATYLQGWATGFDPNVIIYWDVRDEDISVFGNVALVRSTNRQVVRQNDNDVASMSTYTDIYLREGGAWRCIQAQITPVAKANEPGDETIVSVYLFGVKQARR